MSISPQNPKHFTTARKEKIVMRISKGRHSTKLLRHLSRAAFACIGLVFASLVMAVPSAFAGAPEFSLHSTAPDTVDPGKSADFVFTVDNSGTAPFAGTLTVIDNFPAGITPWVASSENGPCEVNGQEVICGFEETEMLPAAQVSISVLTLVDENATGTSTNTIEVDGHDDALRFQVDESITVGPPFPFEFDSFVPKVSRAGTPETQAGAVPEDVDTKFTFPMHPFRFFEYAPYALGSAPTEHPRNVIVHSPPGLIANLHATPVRCTATELTEQASGAQLPNCPQDSQVGTVRILNGEALQPVYSMVPPPGVAAEFGFLFTSVAVFSEARLRPDDYGFDLVTRNLTTTLPVDFVDFNLWGVPADPSHDSSRGLCLDGGAGNSRYHEPDGLCESSAPRKAFLRLPTGCSGQPLDWSIEADSYEHPGVYKTADATTPPQVGCNQLDFTPSLEARPTTNVADSPSGLDFNLHLPQNEDPDGLAEAELKNLRALLPEGLTVNPASADGLGSCSPQQIGLLTGPGQVPAHFNGQPAECPASSKLGSVSVFSPAVGHSLPGMVYLASQHENPFGSLIALYLAIDDPETGIIVKVPVKVELDPHTGRITTVTSESAPLPFEDLKVELDQGPHGALRTPIACGRFNTTSDLTPWSSPEGQDAHPADSFEIIKGAAGSCVASEGAAPSTPKFEAGTLEPRAGAYSPFVLKLGRKDGSQQLTGIDMTLPKGLLARLAGATYCSADALAAAAAKSGRAEQSQPSCPTSSEVGTVQVAAGAGPAPLHVQGKAYMTGPYKGAPLGLAVVTPAVAGPFDLGTVVVRTALQVDPETTQVRAVSDPIPHILQGVPLDIRQLTVLLDRPDYTLNPTSCDPMSVLGSTSLLSGQSTSVTDPFQVGGCTTLRFKPKLALRLKGGTTRTKHPALSATLTFPAGGGANIAAASVALPHSEFLDQSHIGTVCTRVQFAAHQCPAKSVYGTARAISPLLDRPLEGPVYLRSSDHPLPDLVAALEGQFEVDLVGRIDSKNGGIRTTFEAVPDAPVSKFILQMRGGKKGLLQNSTNICHGAHRATVLFDAHNGKTADQRPKLKARCRSRRGHTAHHR